MKKSVMIAYCTVVAVFILGILGCIFVLRASGSDNVEVIRDGEVLYRFNLSTAEDQSIRIDYGDSYNVIEISNGRIRVSEAGCPDKTCVKMGWLDNSVPVVCLPNRLVVRFAGNSEIDAVVK